MLFKQGGGYLLSGGVRGAQVRHMNFTNLIEKAFSLLKNGIVAYAKAPLVYSGISKICLSSAPMPQVLENILPLQLMILSPDLELIAH